MTRQLTRQEMVLLHLLQMGMGDPSELCADERRCAPRIATDLGVTPALISIETSKLMSKGELQRSLTHVRGHPRKLQAWYLTPAGYERALTVSRYCREESIDWRQEVLDLATESIPGQGTRSSLDQRLLNMRTLLEHGELTSEMFDLLIDEVRRADGNIPRILHLFYGDL